MSTLTSSSTLAEVKADYEDNIAYDINDSLTECQDFVIAARILLRRQADEMQQGGSRVREDYRKIRDELKKAEGWLKAKQSANATRGQGSSRLRFHGFDEDFRG